MKTALLHRIIRDGHATTNRREYQLLPKSRIILVRTRDGVWPEELWHFCRWVKPEEFEEAMTSHAVL